MTKLTATLQRLLQDDTGATMVEYALMVALVAAVCVVAVTALGSSVSSAFTSMTGML